MHRSHLLRWFGLIIAVFSVQCLDSLSKDCQKTRTCEVAPKLGSDCVWRYPDGSIWDKGPHKNSNGLWVWPNGTLTKTQTLQCEPSADAGVLADGGLEPGTLDSCVDGKCDVGLLCEESSQRCVKCLDNSQCADSSDVNRGATHACDPRLHACVVCTQDADCGAGSPRRHCRVEANPNDNRCVQCTQKADCDGDDVCDTGPGECTSSCSGENQCKSPKPICSGPPGGLCVGCLSNDDCSGTTPQCNTSRKECVPCVDNLPCTNPVASVCSPSNRCVECTDDSTCRDENKRHCDPVGNSCVACLDSSQCTSRDNSRCNALHVCAPCTDNGQCESDAPVCNAGRCVGCVDDSTCVAGISVCDTTKGECVGCLSNAECNQDPNLARCNTTTQRCEPCQPNSTQCAGKFGVRNICSNSSECVQCTGNGECALDPNKSHCDATGLCAGCRGDSDCSGVTGKHSCAGGNGNNGRCVECQDNQDCNGNVNGPTCNTATNTCVQCLLDTDCGSASASRCVANRCQPCVNDVGGAHCGHITSGSTMLGVCDVSAGPSAGVCVQCTGKQRAACGNNVCNSLLKVCTTNTPVGSAPTCLDCVSDDHCAAGDRCVMETFSGMDLGFSCFPAKPAGACPGVPYATQASLTTIDGEAVDVCMLRRTTCAGINQFGSKPCAADAECGETGLDDGRCDTVLGRCSVPCSSVVDCPTELSTCSTDSVCLL
jgi:hypothetical protein